MTNAQAGHAPFADALREAINRPPAPYSCESRYRYATSVVRAKRTVKEGEMHATGFGTDLRGEFTVEEVIDWLLQVKALADQENADVTIYGSDNYVDGSIEAWFSKERPFTDEEKAEAQHFIDTAVKPDEPEQPPIRWRKPVPMINTGYELIDKAV